MSENLPLSENTTGHPALMSGLVAPFRRIFPARVSGQALATLALAIGFSLIVPGFFSLGSMRSMMFQLPQLGLLALAMAIPMMSGGLNLAIIAIANACGLVMVSVLAHLLLAGHGAGYVGTCIAIALMAGAVLGTALGGVTGWLIVRTKVHPILVTLGIMSIVEGTSIWLTRGEVVSGLPALYGQIGNASLFQIPLAFLAFLVVAGLVHLVLQHTAFGISIRMIGSNALATRYSAVDVDRVTIRIYALSGFLCFCASCLMLARFNSASAAYAKSYLLVTVLAAVLGGVDPNGGFGRVTGLVLAMIMLQLIATGFNLLGFSDYLTLAIWGLVLIGVACAQSLVRKRR